MHKKFLILSLIVFLISLTFQIYAQNKVAIKGKDVVELQSQHTELSKQISELKLEQSKYLSLSYIENKATELGFIPSTQYVVAIGNTVPLPSVVAAAY